MALDHTASIAVIGTGALGRALADGVIACGRSLSAIYSPSGTTDLANRLGVRAASSAQAAEAQVLLLCVPDSVIADVCASLPLRGGHLIVHGSGALDLDVLDSARIAGAHVGSMHPLMVLSRTGRGHAALRGATAAIDGDLTAQTWLRSFADDLGMRTISIDATYRALYHLSAAMVGGLMTGLLAEAADLWTHFGYDADIGAAAIGPMVQEAGRNLASLNKGDVVMGPAARGDAETIAAHVQALRAHAPQMLGLYRELVRSCLRKTSLSEDAQALVEASLTDATTSVDGASVVSDVDSATN